MIYKAFILIFFVLASCSGEDILEKDNIPPAKPHMIHHLGDTGDQIGGQTLNYYVNGEMEFNGIDAVQGEDWISIQWERVSDEDVALIEIYRFNMNDYNNYLDNIENWGEGYDFSTLIDTLESSENSNYTDSSPGLLGYSWFYFIKVLDEAGNSAVSDTACYRLVNRPAILFPGNGPISFNELFFGWELDSGFSPSQSRLLLFNENRELLWVYNPLDFDGTQIEYSGQDLPSQTLIWRVDVFAEDLYYNVQGKNYHVYSGSESIETVLYLE